MVETSIKRGLVGNHEEVLEIIDEAFEGVMKE